MAAIADALAVAFRDYVTDGIPASGEHEPIKSEVRAVGPVIEAALSNIGLGALLDVTKSTRALLNADLAHGVDSVALVYADATDANNDLYVKVGGSGSGSWTLTTVFHDILGGYVSDKADQTDLDAEIAARAADVDAEEAARIAADNLRLSKSGGTMTGAIDMGGQALTNLPAPGSGSAAATKTYVDTGDAANTATLAALSTAMVQTQHRPGDATARFTSTLTGAASAGGAPAGVETAGDQGLVLRVTGAGVVASRERLAVEAGRQYRIRYVVQRITNPSDPSGDTVRLGIQWLNKNKAQISQAVIDDLDLVVVDGRTVASGLIADTAGAGIDAAWTATTRYAVPFVQTYGTDGVTDVEVIAWFDETDFPSADAIADEVEEQLQPLVDAVALSAAQAQEAADTLLEYDLARQLIGPTSLVVGTSTVSLSLSVMQNEASDRAGFVTGIQLYVNAYYPAAIVFVATDNGDGTMTRTAFERVDLPAAGDTGLIPVDLPIAVGQYVGVFAVGVKRAASGATMRQATGLVGTATAYTTTANAGLQFRAEISAAQLADLEQAATAADATGERMTLGDTTLATSGSTLNASLYACNFSPITNDGAIENIGIYCAGDADYNALLFVVSMNTDASGTINLEKQFPIVLYPGENSIPYANLGVQEGWFVGIHTSALVTRVGGGLSLFYTGALPTTNTAKTIVNTDGLQMNATVAAGLQQKAAAALNAFGGLAGVLPVVNDGTTDATAALKKIRTSSQNPYVGPGTYAVTALRNEGDGLWGPGKIKLNGTDFFIPRAPSYNILLREFRAMFARQIGDGSGVCFIGASLEQGTTINNVAGDWLTSYVALLNAYANVYASPGTLPIVHQFREAAQAGVSMGITLPGTPAYGTNGPSTQSIILSAGQALSFTGTYAHIGVFYTQQPGAGSLAFSLDGGAAYNTISADGVLTLDKTTGKISTTAGATGTHTVTATGGSVEVTGLFRLAADVSGQPPPMRVFNFGRNGEKFLTVFPNVRSTSWYAQATGFGGTNPAAIIHFGENDQYTLTPAVIYANACALIDELRALGFKDIWGMAMFRPTTITSGYSAGCSHDGANGAVRGAFADKGVPVLALDSIDFAGLGYNPSHVNIQGQRLYAQMFIESIVRAGYGRA